MATILRLRINFGQELAQFIAVGFTSNDKKSQFELAKLF
jgi:hypothetical protein